MKTKVIKAYIRRQIAKHQEDYQKSTRDAYEDVLAFIEEADAKPRKRTILDVTKEYGKEDNDA